MDLHYKQSEFWMKVAGITFGLWSLAIPFGVYLVRESVATVVLQQDRFNKQFNDYVLLMERRMTLIEVHSENIQRRMKGIEDEQRILYGIGVGQQQQQVAPRR